MGRLLKEADAEKVEIVNSFQLRVDQLEQLVEGMRFTDRQELVDKIETWKKAYERVCIQRDDIEDDLNQIVDIKEVQVTKMGEENNLIREQAHQQKATFMDEIEEVEKHWKNKEIEWTFEKKDYLKKIRDLEAELALARMKAQKAVLTHDFKGDDEEKERLQEIIAQKEKDIAQIELGIQNIVEENRTLSNRVEAVGVDTDAIHESYVPIIAAKDKQIARMTKEHEEMKEILEIEMYKAQEACRAIVENVKKFPNPFEIEVKEMRDKYAQMQSGMIKINFENIQLRESFREVVKVKDTEIKELEVQLEQAAKLLKGVSAIGVLQHMAKKDVEKLEVDLEVDLDGDGKIGTGSAKKSRP
jgi:hypothetical protein